ncbi:MAG TPA: T9SS type A sorting domain-containing protein, partial [Bacteroidia bacterium]
VYFIPYCNTTEDLLYDFSLHIGDTLKTYYTSPVTYPPPVIVSAIDSILIGTSYRKRWTISPASYTTIVINKQIEGIGSTSGLFNWMMESNTSGQPVAYLTCFSKNNQTFYPYYSISTSCQQVTTGIQQYANSNEVSIYPNPASSSLQVTSSGNIQNTTLQITDMLGNTVKQSIIYNPTSIISVADLSEGIYNISISSNEGVVNKRVVIVR